ncbi:MFS transporter [Actinomadura sp. NBRC 104425]|uniref:MFS transporter n=1 Tax=Actinomadura sp. NBRC 104425 TaxID=3032204 RepID=UPI0024A54444|nr:MFS transporter [Actinomadura sp. NBRC 104425]GLZ11597.1 MFS transporter [Actinomadura sp. NBRC 104425]
MSENSTLCSLLRNPAIARLFAARVTGNAGDGFGMLALSFGALHMGYGAAGLSVVVAAKAAPALLVLAGGIVGDRFRRHRVMAGAEVLAAGAWCGLAVCFFAGGAPLVLVCGLAVLAGLARALLVPAERGIAADLVEGRARQAANALLGQSVAVGLLVGLAASGVLVAAVGAWAAAAMKAGTSVVGAALLVRLRTPARRREGSGMLAELRGGWREFTSVQWTWALTGQFTAVAVAVGAFSSVVGPLYMAQGHGGPGGWGMVAAMEAGGAWAGALVAARWRPARPVLAAALLPVTAAGPMLLAGAGADWWLLAAAMVAPGASQTIYGVLWSTTVQATFPPDVLARVNSWNLLGGFALTPVAVLVAGPLTSAFGVSVVAAGLAVLIVAATSTVLLAAQVRRFGAQNEYGELAQTG